MTRQGTETSAKVAAPPEPARFFELAKRHLEQRLGLWDWDDDVEFIGLSWVQFS